MQRISAGLFAVLGTAALLVGCHGGGVYMPHQPAAHGRRVAQSVSPENVCVKTVNGTQTTPSVYRCYVQPNTTLQFSATILAGNNTMVCLASTWELDKTSGSGSIPPVQFSSNPAISGSSPTYCNARTDSITVTLQIGAIGNPASFDVDYNINGPHSECLGTPSSYYNCSAGFPENALQVELVSPLRITDASMPTSTPDVQGTSQTRVAGRKMTLAALSPAKGGGTSTCTWTIPGYPSDVVQGYVVGTTQGTPIPLPSGALSSSAVSFYWIRTEASSQLDVTCVQSGGDGVTLSAAAQYTVKAPSHSITASYGSVAVDANYYSPTGVRATVCATPQPSPWMHFGDGCNKPGVAWTYAATADSDEAGQIAMFQMIQYNVTYTMPSSAPVTSSQQYCADTVIPYESPNPVPAGGTAKWALNSTTPYTDSPAFSAAGMVTINASYQLNDYFMYMPSPVSSSMPSIWVSLDHLAWGYSATYPPLSATPTVPVGGDGMTTLPSWSCAAQNKP